jgi:hypothetical protein
MRGRANIMENKPKQYGLGVLLVHGIGTQLCGDTLVRWGDILLKTLCSATRNRVKAQVGPAGRDGDAAPDSPITAEVRLRPSNQGEKPWLFADGWWADVVLPPSYRELVSWSVRALPWAIAIHIAQRYWDAQKQNKLAAKFVHNTLAILQLLVGLALAPFFVLLLALTLVLGLLPIPQMRSLILAAQGTLVSTVGDCLAFVESPVRAALIRTRILKRLDWLKERCDRTIIIAHSQGAAVVLDALGAIVEPAPQSPLPLVSDAPSLAPAPDTLVTFGAGTNQLASLRSLSAGLPSGMSVNPVINAMSGLLAFGGILGWLFVATFLHQTTVIKVLFAAGVFIVLSGVIGFFSWTAMKLIGWIGKRWAAVKKHAAGVLVGTMSVLMFAVFTTKDIFAKQSELPIFPVSVVFLALIGLIGGVKMILSKEMKSAVTMVIMPLKLGRWDDLYASADPVPNGPTQLRGGSDATKFKSIRIFNLGSSFADHTAYWDNLDGFVLPVVRACAETVESSWKNELPPESPEIKRRAAWRVGWLRLARATVYLSWLVAGAALWSFHGNAVPLPFKLPSWLPSIVPTTARLMLFAAGIIVAASVSFGIVRFVWKRWVRAEQQMVLGHQAIDGNAFWPLVGMGVVIWSIIGLVCLAINNQLSELASINALKDVAPMISALALVSALVLGRLRRGPRVPQPKVSLASTVAGDSCVIR